MITGLTQFTMMAIHFFLYHCLLEYTSINLIALMNVVNASLNIFTTSALASSHPPVILENYRTYKCFPFTVCIFCCIELYEITAKSVFQFHCDILKWFQCTLQKSKVHETSSKCRKTSMAAFYCDTRYLQDSH